jgi:hypothetical protein
MYLLPALFSWIQLHTVPTTSSNQNDLLLLDPFPQSVHILPIDLASIDAFEDPLQSHDRQYSTRTVEPYSPVHCGCYGDLSVGGPESHDIAHHSCREHPARRDPTNQYSHLREDGNSRKSSELTFCTDATNRSSSILPSIHHIHSISHL